MPNFTKLDYFYFFEMSSQGKGVSHCERLAVKLFKKVRPDPGICIVILFLSN